MRTVVHLTDEHLQLLDGCGDEKVQEKVDAARARLDMTASTGLDAKVAAVIADAVESAKSKGALVWQMSKVSRCPVCERDRGYVKYKSGPRRGQPNYDKRLYLPAIELVHSFVRMEGLLNVGACTECMEQLKPALIEQLRDVRAQLPPQLQPEGAPTYRRLDVYECKCGWTGPESEMGRETTILGDGTFPSTCPVCANRRGLFSTDGPQVVSGEFVLVEQ